MSQRSTPNAYADEAKRSECWKYFQRSSYVYGTYRIGSGMERMVELIWRVVRDAAWPGLVVLVAHAVLGEVFGHEPYVDPAMHLAGGVAAAFFFTRLPRLVPQYFGEPTALTRGLLGIGLTCAVAILWELGEYLSDVFLGTRIQRSVGNTMRDLVNGMLGASALVMGERMVRNDHDGADARIGNGFGK